MGCRIGFDLDGVIAMFDWDRYHKCKNTQQIAKYYSGIPLKYDPNDFLTKGDKGYIISFRHINFTKVTTQWLTKHNIRLPFYLLGNYGYHDFSSRQKGRRNSGKTMMINNLKLDVYFEDQVEIVKVLRKACGNTKIIKLGESLGNKEGR